MSRDLRLSLALFPCIALACGNGSGGGNNSSLSITPSPSSAPADGVSTITLNFVGIAADGSSHYNGQINVTGKQSVIFGDGQTGNDLVTMVDGKASETIACAPGSDCVGQIVISASLISNNANASARTQITFTAVEPLPDAGEDAGVDGGVDGGVTDGGADGGTDGGTSSDAGPGLIKFVRETSKYMGINYGTNYVKFPTDTLTFAVTDSSGTVSIPGVPVAAVITYSAVGVGYLIGAFDGGIDGESFAAVSDSAGQFQVKTQSGQKAGTLTVIATVRGLDGGSDISGQQQVSVIGTQPSAAKSTLSCSPVNLPVYAEGISGLPCETTASGAPLATTCTVNLADRFGQVVGVPITVQFFTEAGNFTSASATTPDFGVSGTGIVAGQAQTTLQTTSNVPEDVDPLPSIEPFYMDIDPTPSQRCGNRTYNPRDGLVTVIAVFNGEEQYKDLNASGVYEAGDPFTDLPQPFVDANDNSIYDPGEVCPGSSVSNSCGGPNGVWDANSTMYVETRLLYSGVGVALPTGVLPQGSTITFQNPGPGQLDIAESATIDGDVTWADANLNVGAFTNASPVYNVVVAGPQSVSVTFPAPGKPATPKDGLGMTVTSLTICDAGSVPLGDGGEVPSAVCGLVTQVSQFSGGFTTQYKLSNSNTQSGKGGPFTLTATQQLLGGDPVSNSLQGVSE